MSPRHTLAILVTVVAVAIAAMWLLLFRNHVLAPPVSMPSGPTLPEIGKEFDAQAEVLNRLLTTSNTTTPPTNAPLTPPETSDDARVLPER